MQWSAIWALTLTDAYCFHGSLIQKNFAECARDTGSCAGYCARCVSEFSGRSADTRAQLLVVEAFVSSCELVTDPSSLLLAARLKLGDVLKAPVENIDAYMGNGISNSIIAPMDWSIPRRLSGGNEPRASMQIFSTDNPHPNVFDDSQRRLGVISEDHDLLMLGEDHTCMVDSSGQVRCWGSNRHGRLGHDTEIANCCQPTSLCCATAALPIDLGTVLDVTDGHYVKVQDRKCPPSKRYGSYMLFDEAFAACTLDPMCEGLYDNVCDYSGELTLCSTDITELELSLAGSCVYVRHEASMALECEDCSTCDDFVITTVERSPSNCLLECTSTVDCVAVDVGKLDSAGQCKFVHAQTIGLSSHCFVFGASYDRYVKARGRMTQLPAQPVSADLCFGGHIDLNPLVDGDFDTLYGDATLRDCAHNYNNWTVVFDLHDLQHVKQADVVFSTEHHVKTFEIGTCLRATGNCTLVAACNVKHWPHSTMNLCVFAETASRYWYLRIPETTTGWQPAIAEVSFFTFEAYHPMPASQLAVGSGHSCAVLRGRVKCWGRNDRLQSVPTSPSTAIVKNQPYVPTDGLVTRVAVSDAATCALVKHSTEAIRISCWGSNDHGELSADPNGLAPVMTVVASPLKPLEISAGAHHFCCINGEERRVVCWGAGTRGQLGNGDVLSRPASGAPEWVRYRSNTIVSDVDTVACGAYFTCILVVPTGDVYCWGANTNGELGLGFFSDSSNAPDTKVLSGAQALGVGTTHACVLRDGNMACWGDNYHGQLGLSDHITRSTPTVSISGVIAIHVGGSASCAWVDSRVVAYCWGKNAEGNLGLGTQEASNIIDQLVARRILLPNAAGAGKLWLLRFTAAVSDLIFYLDRNCTVEITPRAHHPVNDLNAPDSVISFLFTDAAEIRCLSFSPPYTPVIERWGGQFFTAIPFNLIDGFVRMEEFCATSAECAFGICHDTFCHCSEGYEGLTCDNLRAPLTVATASTTVQVPCGEIWCLPGSTCTKYHVCAASGTCGGVSCGLHGQCENEDCVCEPGWVGITCEREIATQSPNSCPCLIEWQDPFGLGRCAGKGNMGCCSPDRDPNAWCMDQCGHWRYCTTEFWCEEGARLETDWRLCSRVPQCFGHEKYFCCPADPDVENIPREHCCPEQMCEANPQCVSDGFSNGNCCPTSSGDMKDCCKVVRATGNTTRDISFKDCKSACLNDAKCEVFDYFELTRECYISYFAKNLIGWHSGSGTHNVCEPRGDMCLNANLQCGHGSCVTSHRALESVAVCACSGGWSGVRCEIDPCADVHCGQHGLCDGNTKLCVCDLAWSGFLCDIIGDVAVGGAIEFDPPFSMFTYGALSHVAHHSVISVVQTLFSTRVPGGRRLSTVDIQMVHTSPRRVEYAVLTPTQALLSAMHQIRPGFFGTTLLGQLCSHHGINMSLPPLTQFNQTTLPAGGVHVVFFVNATLPEVNLDELRIVGWDRVYVQDIPRAMAFQTMDPESGRVEKSTLSQGDADPNVIRSWIGDQSITGTGTVKVPVVEPEGFPWMIVLIAGGIFIAVAIAGFCFYQRGFFSARYARVLSARQVYLGDRDQERPGTPHDMRFSTRTAPSTDDGRSEFDQRPHNFRRASEGSGRAGHATQSDSIPNFRRTSAQKDPNVSFSTNAHAEYRKMRNPNPNFNPNPNPNPNPKDQPNAWCEEPTSSHTREYKDDADSTYTSRADKEERSESKHNPNPNPNPESKHKSKESTYTEDSAQRVWEEETPTPEAGEQDEDGGDRPEPAKSYRNRRRTARDKDLPSAEPEAEPQASKSDPYTEYSLPSNRRRTSLHLKRPTKPVVEHHLPNISTRESIDFLGPKEIGVDVKVASSRIAKWMDQNQVQDFEARKKAMRHLSLLWHPDKNADNLEAAKQIFQLIQGKKDWFLRQ